MILYCILIQGLKNKTIMNMKKDKKCHLALPPSLINTWNS